MQTSHPVSPRSTSFRTSLACEFTTGLTAYVDYPSMEATVACKFTPSLTMQICCPLSSDPEVHHCWKVYSCADSASYAVYASTPTHSPHLDFAVCLPCTLCACPMQVPAKQEASCVSCSLHAEHLLCCARHLPLQLNTPGQTLPSKEPQVLVNL